MGGGHWVHWNCFPRSNIQALNRHDVNESLFFNRFLRISLTLSCPMNLKLYPLDRQMCSLLMISCKWYCHHDCFANDIIHLVTHLDWDFFCCCLIHLQTVGPRKIWFSNGGKVILYKWPRTCICLGSCSSATKLITATVLPTQVKARVKKQSPTVIRQTSRYQLNSIFFSNIDFLGGVGREMMGKRVKWYEHVLAPCRRIWNYFLILLKARPALYTNASAFKHFPQASAGE